MTVHVRRIAAAAALVAVGIAALWYFALWSPQSHKLTAAHRDHATAELQISKLNDQVASLQALVKQIPADKAKLSTLEANIPNNPAFDAALNQLNQAASSSGVNLTGVNPSVPPGAAGASGSAATSAASGAAAGAPAITLNITGTAATQAQLESFVSQLTNMSKTQRVFVLDHLQFGGTSTSLTVTINARIFYAGQTTP